MAVALSLLLGHQLHREFLESKSTQSCAEGFDECMTCTISACRVVPEHTSTAESATVHQLLASTTASAKEWNDCFTCTASACPVVPEHTSSYVGSVVSPFVYPTVVWTTPATLWKASSGPQKQPAAKVACCRFSVCKQQQQSHLHCDTGPDYKAAAKSIAGTSYSTSQSMVMLTHMINCICSVERCNIETKHQK